MKKSDKKRVGGFHSGIRRNVNRISVTIIILTVILSSIILHFDTEDHKKHIDQKIKFSKAEKENFDGHINYFQYGIYGFRLFFQQSQFSIFFSNSAPFADIEASIHNDIRMKIGKQQKDGNIFKNSKGDSIDFPWLVLVIFAPVGLIYGFFAFRNREYIKFLMSFESRFKVHSSVVFSRLIILIGTIILIFTSAIIQFAFKGIHLSKGELSYFAVFFLATIAVAVFFLMAGAALGTIRNLFKALSILILCWIILVHLWPDLLKDAFEKYSDNKLESRYSLESRKKKIHTDYEKSLLEINERFDSNTDRLKEIRLRYEQYWNVDFKKIQNIETENMNKIADITDSLHFWSIFNPVTFYKMLNNELSSRGYRQYIEFYKNCIDKHKDFVRFYIDNWVLKGNIKVVPFIEGEEQVFHAKPALPAYFVPGAIIFFGWIVAAYFLSLFGFKRMFRIPPERAVDFEKIELDIKRDRYICLQAVKPRYFADQVFAALTGKTHKEFNGKITLDGKKIESSQPVFYLPEPDKFPADLKVRQLEKLAGLPVTSKVLFKELEINEQAELLIKIAAASDRNILLIPDFVFLQFEEKEQEEIAEQLKTLKGKTVIEIIPKRKSTELPHYHFDLYAHLFFTRKSGYTTSIIKEYK